MALRRLGNYLSRQLWDENVESLERLASALAGRGVISGLELSAGSERTLLISSGRACFAASVEELPAISFQVPPQSSDYVWLSESGFVSLSATDDDPGGTVICLGRVFSDDMTLTSVTEEGRTESIRWTELRTLRIGDAMRVSDERVTVHQPAEFDASVTARGEIFAPVLALADQTTAPPSVPGHFHLHAHNGELFSGDQPWSQNQLPLAYQWAARSLDLTTDLTLTESDAPIQALDPSGAAREVQLPVAVDWGRWFRLIHRGASGTLVIKRGTATLATLGSGQYAEVSPVPNGSGLPAWPATATVATLSVPV